MVIEPGDEKAAGERILWLVNRYALRFDPLDRARFYGRLVRGLAGPMKEMRELVSGDELPAKKPPQRAGVPPRRRRRLGRLAIR